MGRGRGHGGGHAGELGARLGIVRGADREGGPLAGGVDGAGRREVVGVEAVAVAALAGGVADDVGRAAVDAVGADVAVGALDEDLLWAEAEDAHDVALDDVAAVDQVVVVVGPLRGAVREAHLGVVEHVEAQDDVGVDDVVDPGWALEQVVLEDELGVGVECAAEVEGAGVVLVGQVVNVERVAVDVHLGPRNLGGAREPGKGVCEGRCVRCGVDDVATEREVRAGAEVRAAGEPQSAGVSGLAHLDDVVPFERDDGVVGEGAVEQREAVVEVGAGNGHEGVVNGDGAEHDTGAHARVVDAEAGRGRDADVLEGELLVGAVADDELGAVGDLDVAEVGVALDVDVLEAEEFGAAADAQAVHAEVGEVRVLDHDRLVDGTVEREGVGRLPDVLEQERGGVVLEVEADVTGALAPGVQAERGAVEHGVELQQAVACGAVRGGGEAVAAEGQGAAGDSGAGLPEHGVVPGARGARGVDVIAVEDDGGARDLDVGRQVRDAVVADGGVLVDGVVDVVERDVGVRTATPHMTGLEGVVGDVQGGAIELQAAKDDGAVDGGARDLTVSGERGGDLERGVEERVDDLEALCGHADRCADGEAEAGVEALEDQVVDGEAVGEEGAEVGVADDEVVVDRALDPHGEGLRVDAVDDEVGLQVEEVDGEQAADLLPARDGEDGGGEGRADVDVAEDVVLGDVQVGVEAGDGGVDVDGLREPGAAACLRGSDRVVVERGDGVVEVRACGVLDSGGGADADGGNDVECEVVGAVVAPAGDVDAVHGAAGDVEGARDGVAAQREGADEEDVGDEERGVLEVGLEVEVADEKRVDLVQRALQGADDGDAVARDVAEQGVVQQRAGAACLGVGAGDEAAELRVSDAEVGVEQREIVVAGGDDAVHVERVGVVLEFEHDAAGEDGEVAHREERADKLCLPSQAVKAGVRVAGEREGGEVDDACRGEVRGGVAAS